MSNSEGPVNRWREVLRGVGDHVVVWYEREIQARRERDCCS